MKPMKSMRVKIVLALARMFRVPVKMRDEFYGATKGTSAASLCSSAGTT
jgi:hypothetical protein